MELTFHFLSWNKKEWCLLHWLLPLYSLPFVLRFFCVISSLSCAQSGFAGMKQTTSGTDHDHQSWSKSVIRFWPENQDMLKWKCTNITFMTDNWTQATLHQHLRLLTLARLATEQSLTPLDFFLSPGSRTVCSLKCKRMTDMLSGSTCLTELLKSQARTCVYLSLLAFF